MNRASSIWTISVPVLVPLLVVVLLLLVLVSAAGVSGAIVIISARMIVNMPGCSALGIVYNE